MIFRQWLNEFRESLVQSIYKAVDDDEIAGILAAICTGDRAGLTDETKDIYRRSGIIHILAISGLHISFLGMSVYRILRRRLRYFPASFISAFLMISFCVMSDASSSAVRATIMFLVQIIGIGLGKHYDMLNSLSFTAIVMLLFRPTQILSSGFCMSFAAILGAAVVYPVLCSWFRITTMSGYQMKEASIAEAGMSIRDKKRKKRREAFAKGVLMSLSVNLAVLPVTASVYSEIPLYAVLLNLLVVPLMSIVLGCGLLSAVMGLLRIVLGRFFAGLGVYLVWFIRICCAATEKLPWNIIVTGHPETWRMILYYGMLTGVLSLIRFQIRFKTNTRTRTCLSEGSPVFEDKEKRNPSIKKYCVTAGIARHNHPVKKINGNIAEDPENRKEHKILKDSTKQIIRKIFFAGILCGVLLCLLFIGKRPSGLRISFLDVGQGDGILIENPSGTVYLIDGGSGSVEQVGKYRMEGAVRYYGISKIDYSIITHPDTDHISGVMEILEGMPDNGTAQKTGNLTIGTLLMPCVPDNESYNDLYCLAQQKGVEIVELHAGVQLQDKDLILTCLYPQSGRIFESDNGYSAVLDLQYGNFTALLTGDLEEEGEDILLQENPVYLREKYNVLKVAHHGSRFSSSEDFLQRIHPDLAVISAGENNRYGHPHIETLQRLSSVRAQTLVTSSTGEIIVEADLKGRIKIRTKKE